MGNGSKVLGLAAPSRCYWGPVGASAGHGQDRTDQRAVGQFADAGIQLDNGVKTYMKQYGDTVAGKKIEIIRRDVGGPAPTSPKRLAQELVVREGVDILAGFLLTPNALAAADVSAQAKKFMVVMNAATSIITPSRRT
jgi:ABC-type branched-subunit amino acid transport system substrate-binding protein